MAIKDEERQQKERLAAKIMSYVQDQLVIHMPFFNRAILRMPVEFYEKTDPGYEGSEGVGSDGKLIFANADEVIQLYRTNRAGLLRLYMHMIFHCIFCHPFQYDKMSFQLWDFVTDVAVENTILELKWNDWRLPQDVERSMFIQRMRKKVKPLTAENLYHYYFKHKEEGEADIEKAELFKEDVHAFWVSFYSLVGKQLNVNDGSFDISSNKEMQEWKQVSNAIQLDVEAFSKYQDTMPGSAIENIKQIFREKKSYRDFLKKFVTTREEMQVNQEEFDYIYYTYGLDLYGDLPLIEPLEYQEMNKIREFVIAIDTSGSCQGHVVQSFLNKTYTILKDCDSFFSRMNVRIMQCDCEVHSDICITSDREFEEYIRRMQIQGYGGTDFRPVFSRVNELIRKKEIGKLQGLIYFTDGLGTYPGAMPEYPPAFLILEDENEKPKVPAWAMKLILNEEELMQPGA